MFVANTESNIIAMLLRPVPVIKTERRVNSLPLHTVVNVLKQGKLEGRINVSDDALGAPERLARNKADGTLRLNKNGQTVYVVAKEVSDGAKVIITNIVAKLDEETFQFKQAHAESWKQQDERTVAAGKFIKVEDDKSVAAMVAARVAAQKKLDDDRAYADLVASQQKADAEKLAKLEAENAALKEKLTANTVPVTDTTPDTPDIVEIKTKKASRKELAAVA
jgi:hypothetical protein